MTTVRAPMTQLVAPAAPAPVVEYAGLVTRTLAFAIDGAIVNGVAWFVGMVVALGLSLLAIPHQVRTVLAVIGAVMAVLWFISYFVFFWSADGQTPGDRVMAIRVQQASTGNAPGVRRSFLRLCLLPLSALFLCAGFLMILVDGRRRALHDLIVRTVVVYVPQAVVVPDPSGRLNGHGAVAPGRRAP